MEHKKHIKPMLILLAGLLILILMSCSTPPVERSYYVIDYSPVPDDPKLILSNPIPYRVEVSNSRISRVYDRNQLVFRYSQHQIEYSSTDLWAVRLSSAVPDVITNHLIRYNTFMTTQRDFLIERPHYEVITNVNQIEMLQSDFYYGAHVSMDIILRRAEDMEYVVRHSFNREMELFSDNIEVFVQQTSNIIKEETDIFIEKVLRHFERLTDDDEIEYDDPDEDIVVYDEELEKEIERPRRPERIFGLTEEQIETWLAPSPREQLIRESRRDLVGMGRLFLPAMSSSEAEPFYTLLSEDGETNFFERMGSSIYLSPGKYTLQYGSGTEAQKMTRELEIVRDQTKIIEPDWGGLRVRIIDENREPLDSQYEVFAVKDAESYGYGQGALEELGEQLQTWLLRPGTYKLVLNNYPFYTLEDFVTVDVIKGELRTITLVIDSETNSLKGAGIVEGMEQTREMRDWRLSSTVHGSFNLTRDNRIDRDNPTVIYTFNTQFDNRLSLDRYPYLYTVHNLTDLGISKERDEDFRISADSFKLRNTGIYYLARFIGVYARADMETHFFDEYAYKSETTDIEVLDADGDLIRYLEDLNRFRVKPSFFPLVFREGLGLNIRPLNRPRASLNIRFGFGMRQDIYRNVYRYEGTKTKINEDTGEEETFERYQEIESSYREGTEMSLLANIHLPYNISYSTTADILIPFASSESVSYNWENIFSVRLIRQVSIDYKLNLAYNKDVRDYTEVLHNTFIRLTYFLY